MKSITHFYLKVLNYLRSDIEKVGAIDEIVAMAKEVKPSWTATTESVSYLEKCCNRPSEFDEVEFDENEGDWLDTKENFVVDAFRDLSPIRDGLAMTVFGDLWDFVLMNREEDIYWAKKVKSRPDGSAIFILHASDEMAFRRLVSASYPSVRDLEEGVLIRK